MDASKLGGHIWTLTKNIVNVIGISLRVRYAIKLEGLELQVLILLHLQNYTWAELNVYEITRVKKKTNNLT